MNMWECPKCGRFYYADICPQCSSAWEAESVHRYLAKQGAIGGKKSRRKLTKKEARRIALLRWGKPK